MRFTLLLAKPTPTNQSSKTRTSSARNGQHFEGEVTKSFEGGFYGRVRYDGEDYYGLFLEQPTSAWPGKDNTLARAIHFVSEVTDKVVCTRHLVSSLCLFLCFDLLADIVVFPNSSTRFLTLVRNLRQENGRGMRQRHDHDRHQKLATPEHSQDHQQKLAKPEVTSASS